MRRLIGSPGFAALCPSPLPSARVELGASFGARVHETRGQRPVAALSRWIVFVTRYLHKTFVQGQVVTDGVLPPAAVFSVEGEILHDVVVDLVQGKFLLGRGLDRH